MIRCFFRHQNTPQTNQITQINKMDFLQQIPFSCCTNTPGGLQHPSCSPVFTLETSALTRRIKTNQAGKIFLSRHIF